MGANVQLFLRSLRNRCQRLLTVTPALNLRVPLTAFRSANNLGFVLTVPTATIAAEAHANRMLVEYRGNRG